MSQSDVVIVDYGVGNLFNVQRAFALLGVTSVISKDKEEIRSAKKLLLPGVGAFSAGMEHLQAYDLIGTILEFARSGKPLMGICLGMQLLMTQSHENGVRDGLNLIKGKVLRLKDADNSSDFKIPHIGWSALKHSDRSSKGHQKSLWKNSILQDLVEEPFVYFVHSYCVVPDDPECIIAVTEYGKDRFCSVLREKNIIGCQFHPERSGDQGLRILKNFVRGKF